MPNLLTKETIETMYECAADILASVGVEFDMASARELFKKNGAKIEGKKVYLSPSLVAKALQLMPKTTYEPTNLKRLVAASPFSNAPMIIDDLTGQSRRGTIGDAIKMYQLSETSELYKFANPGVVDPEGNDSDDPFIAQIAMLLKYSDKWPNLGTRATKSNTKNGDVYTSAKKAIQLIKEIKGQDKIQVMGQGICPMAPLSYDEDSLINLTVLVEEEQDITIFPCTLSFMTGPESLMGIVIHDIALSLAGAVYIQLLKPGTPVNFSNFSTMTDMRTLQPVYGSPEYLHVQIMFYEVCLHFKMNCLLCGCFSDGIRNDYQAGVESCLTAIAPYSITDVEEIWCYPGHMAAFAGGSFNKIIFDEELMIYCNRVLQGLTLSIDPLLKDKLEKSLDTKSFLTLGDVNLYRKEQRITKIFDKRGIAPGNSASKEDITLNAKKEIDRRCDAYILPERSKTQKKLLSKYLPSLCKY
jgi:trimethylamine--corrinoid protein Co-methyltransferase